MRIYLDNNATTEIHPEVLDAFQQALGEAWGNPSSVHTEGQRARRALEAAREEIAAHLEVSPRELVFTSGGSESNNAALAGLPPGSHVVCSAIEHPSILAPVRELERQGSRVSWIPPDRTGVVPLEAVEEALTPDTALVILMTANNETGVLQPVGEVGQTCRRRGIRFHCDAAQAAGRIEVCPAEVGADTLTLAGHKMHAPKGVGLLYVRQGSSLQPLMRGGAQERRRRAGTENAPLAVALAAAFRVARRTLDANDMGLLRDGLEEKLLTLAAGSRVNGAEAARLPNTSSVAFAGADAESLVMALDLEGVAVSTGSACSSGRVEPSHVLLAMGVSVEDARSSVRFSLSNTTSGSEIDRAAEIVGTLVKRQERRAVAGS